MSISYGGDYITDTDGGKLRPSSAVFRNRIINGAMVIDQRNAGASVTPTVDVYTLDRWSAECAVASKYSVQQNAGSVTPPVGFTNYLGATSTSAYSVGSGDFFSILQPIEGYNVSDLNWGSSNAKTITVSFWVRSSLTGTFGGAIENSAGNRSYPFSYTISSANTWTQASVTITGDTTGTWLTTNGRGLTIRFSLGCGSTYAGTAGSWGSTRYFGVTGQQQVVGTSGATFYITGVQLEVGSNATGFEYRQYQQELALCQRYYEVFGGQNSYDFYIDGYNVTNASLTQAYFFKTSKRTAPTLTFSGTFNYGNASNFSLAAGASNTEMFVAQIGITSTGRAYMYSSSNGKITASAEL